MAAPTATIALGVLIGKYSHGFGESFLGIPYALPPVGGRRFAAPVDFVSPYPGGTFNATSYGGQCPQGWAWHLPDPIMTGSEDCLNLNVFRPRGTHAGSKLPVNVFIHGGAFEYGSNSAFAYSTHLYDGTNFTVQQNALMVTINYRLGALGWMAFPHDSGDPSRAVRSQLRSERPDVGSALGQCYPLIKRPKPPPLWGGA